MKIFKAVIINIVLLLVLGGITVGFFYGWKYYKQKYDQEKEEYSEDLALENSIDKYSLLIGEKFIDKKNTKWSDLYFIDARGDERFSIDIAHDVSILANPQATKTNLFYYEPGEKKESLEHMILWAADFKGASENKIAAFSKDYYPQGLWMSPDYSTVAYMRSYIDDDENSYWVFHNDNGVARELIPPASNLNPAPYQGFNAQGDNFYYFEKIDDTEYRLNKVKVNGSIINPAFRGVEWKNIDWEDLWEVRPIVISPVGDAMVYLDKNGSKDFIKSTEIKKVSELGEFSTLVEVPGNIYELSWSSDEEYIAYNHVYYNNNETIEKITVEIIGSDELKPEVVYETSGDNLIYDIFWNKTNSSLYFVDNQRGKYSEIIKVNLNTRESEVIYHRDADEKNDYIKILQTIDIPKELDWKNINDTSVEQKSSIDLQEVLKYIQKNINILVEDKPKENNQWETFKIGYITDNDFYVEYTDNFTTGRLLMHCNKDKNKIKCETTASYQPKDYQWSLTSGIDNFSGKDAVYYEYWDGIWQESYSSAIKEVFVYNNEDIKQVQKAVDEGGDQWRLDPVKVILREIPEKYNFDENKDSFDLFISEDGESRVKVKSSGKEYEVKLFQLVREGEGGVWTLGRIKIL